jgi:protein-tyrosine phosphatase
MRILMVCLGNICRSPLAHGVMEKLATDNELDWYIDSAGTSSWHLGEAPDARAIQCASRYKIDISTQRSRQITLKDFATFDLIFAMDKDNFKELQKMAPNGTMHKVKLLMDYFDNNLTDDVPDPYYNGAFEHSYLLIQKACNNFVNQQLKEKNT